MLEATPPPFSFGCSDDHLSYLLLVHFVVLKDGYLAPMCSILSQICIRIQRILLQILERELDVLAPAALLEHEGLTLGLEPHGRHAEDLVTGMVISFNVF